MQCILCDTDGLAVDRMVFYLNDKQTPETAVLQCPDCGYVWLDPPIDSDELNFYYAHQDRIPTESVAYKEQVAYMQRFIKFEHVVTALDIGSYDGRLLALLFEAGVRNTISLEPDEEYGTDSLMSIDAVLAKYGEDSLGLITMGHVFEHIQDPTYVLEQCKELLYPGGTLFIEVPDLADPQVQVVPFWTPFHHSYFTSDTLTYMLEKAGFKVLAIQHTGYRSIRVIARYFTVEEANLGDTPPPHSAVAGVEMYHSKRAKLIEELRDRLSWVEHENLAIFGAGDHTRWLLRFFPDLVKNLICFLDSSVRKQSETLEGVPIIAPENCPDDVDRIIISSYDTQDEMATIVGKRAMQLYEDVRAYDVWLGE